MAHQAGDDLGDDFVPDDLVALSGGESDFGDADADAQALLTSDELPSEDLQEPAAGQVSDAKKRKRREKAKEKKAKKRKLVESVDTPEQPSVAAQPPNALAEYLAARQAKTYKDMSEIELDDLRIPDSAIADTTVWTNSRSLDHLVDFITKVLPTLRTRLGQRPKSNGAPTLLVVSAAALRVTDITRVLKVPSLRGAKGGEVAKLFARHFKVEEHRAYLKRTKVGAAVGTPGRIGKLLSDGEALSVSALSHILLDVSYRDLKKRTLFDIPETRDEVFQLVLGAPKVMEAIKAGKVQVVLF